VKSDVLYISKHGFLIERVDGTFPHIDYNEICSPDAGTLSRSGEQTGALQPRASVCRARKPRGLLAKVPTLRIQGTEDAPYIIAMRDRRDG
jgi:hypothetical protein